MSEQVIKAGELLSKINTPADLRKVDKGQLLQVCSELRQFIVDTVSVHGGHFAASLGVVELTVALHYVFNTPVDQLVWDVGHQAYGHKILTGRRDVFHTNRVFKGLSGFPKRDESEYDTFGVGHSSTSISAALGMAMASHYLKDEDKQHIAVIGDGSMTAGMAFEALNHAGVADSNVLIILNDNCMAIDPNVGALKDYLVDITTSKTYNRLRNKTWKMLVKLEQMGINVKDFAVQLENGVKGTVLKQSNLFESLNIRYFGPVDGHDINHLVHVLEDLKKIKGPKLLHCVTVKGKGYAPAEKDQVKWHAPGKFDKITGEITKTVIEKPQAPKYQDVFGHTLVELAEKNPKIWGITPAMPSGSSLNIMMKAMPDRAIDVGIAEQHAVTLSAGLATQGLKPFCNIYSSFMQRAYDQVVHDVALQNLPVVFCLDRAGIAGADGPTHHGAFDIAYFRCIPNMVVAAPMNEAELRNMMYAASEYNGPYSIRYPRGQGTMPNWRTPLEKIEVGKGRCVSHGSDIAILSLGTVGNFAQEAISALTQKGLTAPAHYDMRYAKPLDVELLHDIFKHFKKIITVEDGCLQGGFGSAIIEFMTDNGYQSTVKRLGMPDEFVEHGEQDELYALCHYDTNAIINQVYQFTPTKVKA
jgi:1-deoxy-D-xylulose-5-phosphate synthase